MIRQVSLQRPLIIYPLAFHLATLLVSFALLIAVAIRFDSGGPYTDEQIVPVIARAIERGASNELLVVMTEELAELKSSTPQLWFIVEDDDGHSVTYGRLPPLYSAFVGRLSGLSYAQMRDRAPPYEMAAVIRREQTDIGHLTIMGHGALSELSFMVVMASNTIAIPIFCLLTLTSLIVTPWIVRRSLAGISRIAHEAEQINPERRGGRLSEEHVPREIAPLVRSMNDVLGRLDEGYERQRRFLAYASHELRTPIAILRSKVESADSEEARSLGMDVQRLANVAEQLLDLERLATDLRAERVDLAEITRRVIADLAPVVIADGRTIEVEISSRGTCSGNSAALERVITNLVQNAVDHGGHHVLIKIDGTAFEVEDDGPGIPPEERKRVFEPFYRLRARSTGSGLGLNLVHELVARQGGRVLIDQAKGGGTVVRVELSSS